MQSKCSFYSYNFQEDTFRDCGEISDWNTVKLSKVPMFPHRRWEAAANYYKEERSKMPWQQEWGDDIYIYIYIYQREIPNTDAALPVRSTSRLSCDIGTCLQFPVLQLFKHRSVYGFGLLKHGKWVDSRDRSNVSLPVLLERQFGLRTVWVSCVHLSLLSSNQHQFFLNVKAWVLVWQFACLSTSLSICLFVCLVSAFLNCHW